MNFYISFKGFLSPDQLPWEALINIIPNYENSYYVLMVL